MIKRAEQVAIKILKTPPPSKFSERHKRVLENEIAVMRRIKQKIDHRNVLQMIDVHREKDQCLVVMECCEGGELFDRIVAKQHYDERCAAELLDEIISGLETMHAEISSTGISNQKICFTRPRPRMLP